MAADRGRARRARPRRRSDRLGPAGSGDLRAAAERQRPRGTRGGEDPGRVLGAGPGPRQLHPERLLPLARRQRRQGRGPLPLHRPQPDAGRRARGRAGARGSGRALGPRGLEHRVRAHELRVRVVRVGRKERFRRRRPGRPLHGLHQRACRSASRSTTRRPRSACASRISRSPRGSSPPMAIVVRPACGGEDPTLRCPSPASPPTRPGTSSTSGSTGGSSAARLMCSTRTPSRSSCRRPIPRACPFSRAAVPACAARTGALPTAGSSGTCSTTSGRRGLRSRPATTPETAPRCPSSRRPSRSSPWARCGATGCEALAPALQVERGGEEFPAGNPVNGLRPKKVVLQAGTTLHRPPAEQELRLVVEPVVGGPSRQLALADAGGHANAFVDSFEAIGLDPTATYRGRFRGRGEAGDVSSVPFVFCPCERWLKAFEVLSSPPTRSASSSCRLASTRPSSRPGPG